MERRERQLLHAAGRVEVEDALDLLADGVSPDSTNERGEGVSHLAAGLDAAEVLLALALAGGNLEGRNAAQETPVGVALLARSERALLTLAALGCALDQVDGAGHSAEELAEESGDEFLQKVVALARRRQRAQAAACTVQQSES